MSRHPRLAYILLAAGGSTRFGACKQLATIDFKQTLLGHTLDIALTVAPGELFLVLGANKQAIIDSLNPSKNYPRTRIITNPNWRDGIGSSIAIAVRNLAEDEYDGVMVLLGDQIAITADQLKRMRECWYQDPQSIVAAKYDKVVGSPAIFPKTFFNKLRTLSGDNGARSLLRESTYPLYEFALDEAAQDIDTENQLNHWQINNLLDDLSESR